MGLWFQTFQESIWFHLDVLELIFLPRSNPSPMQSPEGNLIQRDHAFCQYIWQVICNFIALNLGVHIWPPRELSWAFYFILMSPWWNLWAGEIGLAWLSVRLVRPWETLLISTVGQEVPGKCKRAELRCFRYVVFLVSCSMRFCPGWESCSGGFWVQGYHFGTAVGHNWDDTVQDRLLFNMNRITCVLEKTV